MQPRERNWSKHNSRERKEEEKKTHVKTSYSNSREANERKKKKAEKESLAPAKRLSVFFFCVDGGVGVGCFLFSFSSLIREL
jgi:F0F1-type ATP synthase assembly protein I